MLPSLSTNVGAERLEQRAVRVGGIGVGAAAHAEAERHAVLVRQFRVFQECVPGPAILQRSVLRLAPDTSPARRGRAS